MQPGLEPRRAAAAMMTAVTAEGALLSEVVAKTTEAMPPPERARAQRLATEALRWAPRSDRLLSPFLRNKPEDEVMNLLRLALYEIYVDGAAAHGAVNAAVSLSVKSKAGMVNAVLRNVQRSEVDWDSLPPPSLPKWLRKPLVRAWGRDAVAEMEGVFAAPVPLDLTGKAEAELLAVQVGGQALPTGSVRVAPGAQVTALPGYTEGDWWVQDAAAALPVRLLDLKPGTRVLDLCAAPGGKTMQLAALGADVVAVDQSETRLERVKENLKRTGLAADIVTADATEWSPEEAFDAILLDAPCSATGTLRRHPDLAYAKASHDLSGLVSLQSKLLDRAITWLKPGGHLVYCTCSLFPEEGEGQIEAVLQQNDTIAADTLPDADWIDPGWRVEHGGLRVLPHHWADCGGIDGFFMVRLRKTA